MSCCTGQRSNTPHSDQLFANAHGLNFAQLTTYRFCLKQAYWFRSCICLGVLQGWGCGYRTLQTLCSWAQYKLRSEGQKASPPPTLHDIQQALVTMGDKPTSFLGSREWIGSVEVAMCLDYFYDVSYMALGNVHSRKDSECEQPSPM